MLIKCSGVGMDGDVTERRDGNTPGNTALEMVWTFITSSTLRFGVIMIVIDCKFSFTKYHLNKNIQILSIGYISKQTVANIVILIIDKTC